MKRKRSMRIVAFLTVIIILALLIGCNNSVVTTTGTTSLSAATTKAAGSSLPIVTTPIKLTWFTSPPVCTTVNNLGDLEAVKELEKRTGIDIEFIHPSRTDTGEMLSTILASGQYPDIIRNAFKTYKGGIVGAMKDGILVDYTDLVKQYAVNYNKMVTAMGAEKVVISDDRKQVAFGSTFACPEFVGKSFAGLAIRQDWLDELNLAIPVTISDWYTVLKAFKEKKKCEAPLCLAAKTWTNSRNQAFVGSFGAAYTFLYKNKAVKYGPILPEFKTFLETYSKWYAEGLINQDLATTDHNKNVLPMVSQGQAGAVEIHPISFANIYAMVDFTKNPKYKLAPCPYPQVVKGQVPTYRHTYAAYNPNPSLITVKNKYPVESVKLIDYLYSDDGIFLETWGVTEGRTYTTDAQGVHNFTDLIAKNPEGLAAEQAKYKYTLGDLQGHWNWEMEKKQYSLPEHQNSTWGLWSSSATSDSYIYDILTLSVEENSAYSSVMSQVEPYAQEMILKFIMGLEPLSNFDTFVSNVKSMGITKAEEAKNAAYQRFLSR